MTARNEADSVRETDVRWSTLDLEELIEAYWNVVAPAMVDEGMDPETERPTHEWLSNRGFRGLVYALGTYHDRTFGEFWAEDLDLADDSGYAWEIDDGATVRLLEDYLESRRSRGDLSPSSVETLRYRLARYARAYAEENEGGDLLAPVEPGTETPRHEATDAAWAAFDRLHDELRASTLRRIHGAVDGWYAHLVRRKRAELNPVDGLDDEYGWGRSDEEGRRNPALAPEHVRQLYEAAESPEDALLVVALCAWGLRSGEVAALHRSQLALDADPDAVPYATFAERKNGPGEVSILYGADVARDRLADLADADAWNGHLFPSPRSESGHVTRQTVLNRFDSLAERAGLPDEIAGRKPVPQMARRFWYDAFSATQEQLLEEIGEIAAEQGSASPGVVVRNYLSPDRRRELRRESMRKRLAAAFDVEAP